MKYPSGLTEGVTTNLFPFRYEGSVVLLSSTSCKNKKEASADIPSFPWCVPSTYIVGNAFNSSSVSSVIFRATSTENISKSNPVLIPCSE